MVDNKWFAWHMTDHNYQFTYCSRKPDPDSALDVPTKLGRATTHACFPNSRCQGKLAMEGVRLTRDQDLNKRNKPHPILINKSLITHHTQDKP